MGFKQLAARVLATGRYVLSTGQNLAVTPQPASDPPLLPAAETDVSLKKSRNGGKAERRNSVFPNQQISAIPEFMKMKTIVVWNGKGGSAKSTTLVHLAAAAEHAGDGPVVISDTDPQGTAADWSNQRKKASLDTPRYAGLTLGELDSKLQALDQAGAAYLFIDTAPSISAVNNDLFARADIILIPLNPTPADLRSLVKALPLARRSGKPFYFVLSRVRPNLRNNDGTALALDALGLVLPTRMHERVIYAETFAHGRTALDIDPNGVAGRETASLWRDLKEKMESRNS